MQDSSSSPDSKLGSRPPRMQMSVVQVLRVVFTDHVLGAQWRVQPYDCRTPCGVSARRSWGGNGLPPGTLQEPSHKPLLWIWGLATRAATAAHPPGGASRTRGMAVLAANIFPATEALILTEASACRSLSSY